MNKFFNVIFYSIMLVLISACAGSSGMSADASKRKAVNVLQTSRGVVLSSDERVLFDSGRSAIKSEGQIYIDRVVIILKDKTKSNVVVEGYTDNVGSAEMNLRLSEARAQSVRSALVKAGVDAKRISAKGFGLSNPVADNSTPEGRQINRRTEILVLGEKVENIGGESLGDRLSEGFSNFMKDPAAALKSAFGG